MRALKPPIAEVDAGISVLAQITLPTANPAMGGKISIDTSRSSDFREVEKPIGIRRYNPSLPQKSSMFCPPVIRVWGRKQAGSTEKFNGS